MARNSVAFIAALLLAAAAHATDVNGTISANTTWTMAGSPYRVTGALTVTSGITLTVEQGVDVLFDADVPFIASGSLVAAGTETDSIRFLAGTSETWRGLRVVGDSSYASYTRISGGYARGETRDDSTGGGVYLSGSGTRFVMEHGVISGNGSTWSGAGILGDNGAKGWFTDCRIVDNHSEHDGGGLYNTGLAEIVFTDCEISGNTAGDDGGGFDNSNGIVTLSRCLISGNDAYEDAGGVGNHGLNGVATFETCAIVHNTCGVDGGGIRTTGGATLHMTNGTIAGNVSTSGGALYSETASTKSDLVGSIVWSNTADNKPSVFVADGGGVYVSYSIVEGGYSGIANFGLDPLFVDEPNGDYHLQEGSPAIDTGSPRSPLDPDGSRADMGAYPSPFGVIVAINPQKALPERTKLNSAYPNPFNPVTTVSYQLAEPADVGIAIYSVSGQRVMTLVDGHHNAGWHDVSWNGLDDTGRGAASGVYIIRFVADDVWQARRVTLIR